MAISHFFRSQRKITIITNTILLCMAMMTNLSSAETIKSKKLRPKSVIVGLVSSSDPVPVAVEGWKKNKSSSQAATPSNVVGLGSQGAATTKTEILAGQNVAPMLGAASAQSMIVAEQRYSAIVASGGWPSVSKSALRLGATGDKVEALNKRLFVEGYLRIEATQGEFAQIFTSATADALKQFQRNNGLAVTGQLDGSSIAALNIPAAERLRTIRANIPRLNTYSAGLGSRYLLVNIPAQQIEAVAGGKVHSRHNAIVGKPARPTPVVMTDISKVKFNPYWNAPASIIERDIIPRIKSGGSRVLDDMDITVFRGVGGPEIDPDSVDWDEAIADDFHFRQEPGPKNAMATAKIEFDSPFGIYLHDTPEKQLFKTGSRFYSSGCVRVEQMPMLVNWLLNGQDGYNNARIAELADTLERVDVPVISPPQLRVAYLTAWPVGNVVAFRKDIYELDNAGFTMGQPMPVGETYEGSRFTLKPIPRTIAASDGDGGFSFFGKSSKGREKGKSYFGDRSPDETETSQPSFILGLNAASKALPVKLKTKDRGISKKKATPTETTKSTIVGLGAPKQKTKKKIVKSAPPKKKVADCKPANSGTAIGCTPKGKTTAAN